MAACYRPVRKATIRTNRVDNRVCGARWPMIRNAMMICHNDKVPSLSKTCDPILIRTSLIGSNNACSWLQLRQHSFNKCLTNSITFLHPVRNKATHPFPRDIPCEQAQANDGVRCRPIRVVVRDDRNMPLLGNSVGDQPRCQLNVRQVVRRIHLRGPRVDKTGYWTTNRRQPPGQQPSLKGSKALGQRQILDLRGSCAQYEFRN